LLNLPPEKSTNHPDDDQLQTFVNGYEASTAEVDFVEAHLENCQQCQARVDDYDVDPLIQLIRQTSGGRKRKTNVPRITAGYDVIEEIGRGAAGIVYKARQPGTDRIVALKMLVAGVKAKRSDLARFNREAQALSRLDHPNVVRVFDVGEQDGVPFLAMEWIEGSSLSQYLNRNTLDHRQAANLVGRLAGGIAYVHQQGILHRDLKPQNILIASNKEPIAETDNNFRTVDALDHAREKLHFESAKICDFGLARFADNKEFQTRTGETLGTPSYMAPEQIGTNANLLTENTDVYGLGAILYECLTGRPPFYGNTPVETLHMVLESEPVAVSALRPNVPKDLEVICHRCLAKNPKDRFLTALELQNDLERFVQNKPIMSRPIPPHERAIRWIRRNPWPMTVACLIFVAAATVSIGQLVNSKKLSDQRDGAIIQYEASRAAIWEMLDYANNESHFDIPQLQQLQTNQLAKALQLFEKLSLEDGTQGSLMDLAQIQMQYGSALVAQGKHNAGAEQLLRSRKTYEKLNSISPNNIEIMNGLVSSKVKLAHTLNLIGKTDNGSSDSNSANKPPVGRKAATAHS